MTVPYKLEPFDIVKLKRMGKRKPSGKYITKRDVVGVIEEFVNGEHDCCIVCVANDERQAHVETCIIRRVINRDNYTNVKSILRGKTVYLVKRNVWEVTK